MRPASQYAHALGTYRGDLGEQTMEVVISMSNDTLFLEAPGMEDSQIFPLSDTEFYREVGAGFFQLIRNEEAVVTGLSVKLHSFDVLLDKIDCQLPKTRIP